MTGVVEALNVISRDIEALGALLCADADIAARHAHSLQDVDRIAQVARQLATVLDAEHPSDAVELIGIDALRHQLQEAAEMEPVRVACQ
ncbi:hypothetical protein [Croceicoccus sp. YJ47]|uniref:hypothetical protein n=1 Tax=Croceicoccus sp. YJ47 TaxID=2798724 RepID=UPI001920E57D|nr:hypothetical protein [Croceicoccus sp. YJ47]QQN73362.1 hypothetical protein JD971_11000 [Croceicoccus sp. YJ47]